MIKKLDLMSHFDLSLMIVTPFWRGGRAVEGAALEMLFRGNSNEGSNPSLSVKTSKKQKLS